jgi:hypothetical protein
VFDFSADVIDFLFGPPTHVQGDAVYSPPLGATPPPPAQALENVVTASFRVRDPSSASASAALLSSLSSASASAAAPALCTASFNFVVAQQQDSLVIQGSKAQLSVSLFGADAPLLRWPDGRTATVQLPVVENPHAAFLQHVTQEVRRNTISPSDGASELCAHVLNLFALCACVCVLCPASRVARLACLSGPAGAHFRPDGRAHGPRARQRPAPLLSPSRRRILASPAHVAARHRGANRVISLSAPRALPLL